MKKLGILLTVFAVLASLFLFTATANTGKSILNGAANDWIKIVEGGETPVVEVKDGKTIVSGSAASWPSVFYTRKSNEYLTATVAEDSLYYNFTVEGGNTNIIIFFDGSRYDDQNTKSFSFFNLIDSPTKDPGSGDLGAGTYKGTISLAAMAEHALFPASAIKDGKVQISGVRIFTVMGAKVTVHNLEIVKNGDAPSTSDSTSVSTSSAPSSSSDSSSTATTSSSIVNTTTSSSVASTSSKTDTSTTKTEEEPPVVLYIAIGVAALVLVASVIVIVVKRKKK